MAACMKFLNFHKIKIYTPNLGNISCASNTRKYTQVLNSYNLRASAVNGHKSHLWRPVSVLTNPHLFYSNRSHQSKFSTDSSNTNRQALKLMEFTERIWPNPVKSLRNFLFSLLIKGYFDPQFRPDKFVRGAEQAIVTVSSLISQGKFEDLEGLVDREAIHEIKHNYENLSDEQRDFVAVNSSDLMIRFIYEIGVIFNDATNQKFIEITTVFQGLRGLGSARESGVAPYPADTEESRRNTYICNYRFVREFTKGIEDTWTINKLNHFKAVDLVNDSSLFKR